MMNLRKRREVVMCMSKHKLRKEIAKPSFQDLQVVKENELVRYQDSRVSMACTYTIAVYGPEVKQLPLIVGAFLIRKPADQQGPAPIGH